MFPWVKRCCFLADEGQNFWHPNCLMLYLPTNGLERGRDWFKTCFLIPDDYYILDLVKHLLKKRPSAYVYAYVYYTYPSTSIYRPILIKLLLQTRDGAQLSVVFMFHAFTCNKTVIGACKY